MHPAIHIIAFIIFTLSISLGGHAQLLMAVLILVAGFIIVKPVNNKRLLIMLARLKWLWLSLLLVYFWFTPGELLFAGHAWSPSVEGVFQGLMRICILIGIVIAAYLLVEKLSREQLIVGLDWLVKPLACAGVSCERFAVRMMLVIETVPKIQVLYTEHRAEIEAVKSKNSITRIGGIIAGVFVTVVEQAETAACNNLEIPEYGKVVVVQFLYPVLLAAGFWFVGYY